MDYLRDNFSNFLVNNKNQISSKRLNFENIREEEEIVRMEKLYY
jgi:hypothetical protein